MPWAKVRFCHLLTCLDRELRETGCVSLLWSAGSSWGSQAHLSSPCQSLLASLNIQPSSVDTPQLELMARPPSTGPWCSLYSAEPASMYSKELSQLGHHVLLITNRLAKPCKSWFQLWWQILSGPEMRVLHLWHQPSHGEARWSNWPDKKGNLIFSPCLKESCGQSPCGDSNTCQNHTGAAWRAPRWSPWWDSHAQSSNLSPYWSVRSTSVWTT